MMEKSDKVISIMGVQVPEEKLRASLQDVIKKRGMTATLYLEDTEAAKSALAQARPPDYYNIYKYAFF